MYRPNIKNILEKHGPTPPEAEGIEEEAPRQPYSLDEQIAHVEALYNATESELLATQHLDNKMQSLEEARTKTRDLIQTLNGPDVEPEEQQYLLALIHEKEREVLTLEAEVAQSRVALDEATEKTTLLARASLMVQFEKAGTSSH